MLAAALLTVQVPSAKNPVAAAGITLQTLAGLLAAIQLWANSASDALVAMFMYVGSLFIGRELAPDGEALTALQSRLNANDWIWPIVGLVFVLGGMLQVAVA